MTDLNPTTIKVVAFDIFGTTVDWHTGVATQAAEIFTELGLRLDAGQFASEWRDLYRPSLRPVLEGSRTWVGLDTLHRETLNELLARHGVAGVVDDAVRGRLVQAWHRLPAWPDAVEGLARLRRRYIVAALSNGGFAQLVHLAKYADLPFDCVISAELARTYKPHPRVYRMAADLLEVRPDHILLTAAHGWDLDGGSGVGTRTAFIHRPHEQGPHRQAGKGADVTSDLRASSFTELAATLGV